MKKRSLFLAVLVLTLSLLIGCSGDSSTDQDFGEPVTATAGAMPPLPEDLSLRVVGGEKSNYTGSEYDAITQTGVYGRVFWWDELKSASSQNIGVSNLTYTDVETGIKTFLCGVPGCVHNNESCTSYIEFTGRPVLFTDSDEQNLFVMDMKTYGVSYIYDTGPDKIYKMDLDGSNREEFYVLPANENFYDRPIISDSENIYVSVTVTTDATKEPDFELRRINIETGQAQTLFTSGIRDIVSAFDDIVVMIDYGFDMFDINDNQAFIEIMEKRQEIGEFEYPNGETSGVKLIGYSVKQNEFTTLYEMTTNGGYVLGKYHIAYAKTDDNTAKAIVVDLSTGERKDITDLDISENAYIESSEFYDETFAFKYHRSEPTDDMVTQTNEQGDIKILEGGNFYTYKYLINVNTAKVDEVSLYRTTDRYVFPPVIFATFGDTLMVETNVDPFGEISLVGSDGVKRSYETQTYEYAFISKQDYIDGNANYRHIEDLTQQ